ncbi:MAG: diaminobutyrate--2-oxoglutarate transaminase [Candidatus Saccharibacteria bacterium]
MDLKIFNDNESAVRGYIRSFPVVFNKAIGSIMTDTNGKDYIDFFAGAGTLNYGHNNQFFKPTIIEYLQSDAIIHSLDMATVAKKEFITAFVESILKPRNLDYKLQFTGPTGTNAVEAAMKLARQVTGQTNILAFTHAFHGVSAGALTATANQKFRKAAGYPLSNVTFMPYDGYLGDNVDTVHVIEKMIDDPSSGLDKPAAILVETIQGEGGINIASDEWLQGLEKLCKDRDILLIVDDIQSGCGRSGDFFSFEKSGINPDIVTLSKSISGYGLPMALVLLKPEYDIWKPGAHNGTFRGNNLAFVGATAAIKQYWTDDGLSQEVKRKEVILRDRLLAIAQKYPDTEITVRGRGLMYGLASAKQPDLAEAIAQKAFELGLIIETSGAYGEVLKFLPSITIDDDTLNSGIDIVEKSIQSLLN